MVTVVDRLSACRSRILEIANQHGATSVRIFGSAARGDYTRDSDIDILVSMQPGSTLLDFIALWQDLESLLGIDVDLVSENGINPHLQSRILAEAVEL